MHFKGQTREFREYGYVNLDIYRYVHFQYKDDVYYYEQVGNHEDTSGDTVIVYKEREDGIWGSQKLYPNFNTACECGAEFTKQPGHSYWCDAS